MIFKNKAKPHRLTCPLTPGFVFKEVQVEDHKAIPLSELPLTFLLKPASGFFYMGFFKISHPDNWGVILGNIQGEIWQIQGIYPSASDRI